MASIEEGVDDLLHEYEILVREEKKLGRTGDFSLALYNRLDQIEIKLTILKCLDPSYAFLLLAKIQRMVGHLEGS